MFVRFSTMAVVVGVMFAPAAGHAQSASAIGVGMSSASSSSQSSAAAVNNNTISSSNTFTSPAATTTRLTGTSTVRNVPATLSPGLAAAGIETCLGSVSVGGSFVGGGFSFGSTVKDDDCNRRLYARQLYNMGFRSAAAVLQCITPEVNYAMAVAGTPCPNPPNMQPVSVPVAPPFGGASGSNPPVGFVANPAYLQWQQEQADMPRNKSRRRAAQRESAIQPLPSEAFSSFHPSDDQARMVVFDRMQHNN